MRILLPAQGRKGKNNWFWEIFRSNLGKYHDVIYYGPEYILSYQDIPVPEVYKMYQPADIILVHLPQEKSLLRGLEEITHVPKVHIMGDYAGFYAGPNAGRNKDDKKYHKFLDKHRFDMIFAHDKFIYYKLKDHYPMFHIPFCVDTSLYYNKDIERDHDTAALYSANPAIYPHRRKVQEILRANFNCITGKNEVRWDYINHLNRTKIFVNNNEKWHILSLKLFEATACGAMFLTDRIDFMDEYGYEDGKHLVIYNNDDDMVQKVRYYLEHEDEREKIAEAGRMLTVEKYSMDAVIADFTNKVVVQLG